MSEKTNEKLVTDVVIAAWERGTLENGKAAYSVPQAALLARMGAQDAEIERLKIAMSTHDIGRDVAARTAAEKMRERCAKYVLWRIKVLTSEESARILRTFADEIRKLDVDEVLRGE